MQENVVGQHSWVGRAWDWLTRRSGSISAWFLGIVFLLVAIDKLFHLEGFYNAVASYAVVPSFLETAVPLPVIGAELAIAIGLFIPRCRRGAAWSAAGLLGVFSIALAGNLLYGPVSVCGCWFTLGANTPSTFHILQNVVMLLLAWTVTREVPRTTSREAEIPPPVTRAEKSNVQI